MSNRVIKPTGGPDIEDYFEQGDDGQFVHQPPVGSTVSLELADGTVLGTGKVGDATKFGWAKPNHGDVAQPNLVMTPAVMTPAPGVEVYVTPAAKEAMRNPTPLGDYLHPLPTPDPTDAPDGCIAVAEEYRDSCVGCCLTYDCDDNDLDKRSALCNNANCLSADRPDNTNAIFKQKE